MFKPRIGATCVKVKSKDKKTLGHLDPEPRRRLSERAVLCGSEAEGSLVGELRPSRLCLFPGLEPFDANQEAWSRSWAFQAGAPPALGLAHSPGRAPRGPSSSTSQGSFPCSSSEITSGLETEAPAHKKWKGESARPARALGSGGSWGEVTRSGGGKGAGHPTQPHPHPQSGTHGETGAGEHLPGRLQGGARLTQRHQAPVVVQHHRPVQTPLRGAQPLPLLLREVHGHVPKRHQTLEWQRHAPAQPAFLPSHEHGLDCPPSQKRGVYCISCQGLGAWATRLLCA